MLMVVMMGDRQYREIALAEALWGAMGAIDSFFEGAN
jgi:hypothetical protein